MKRLVLAIIAAALAVSAARGEVCKASVYEHPQPTANGERLTTTERTVAHRTLPFGTCLNLLSVFGEVTNARINDRGPFVEGRCLDLAPGTAKALKLWKGSAEATGLNRVYFWIADCWQ